MRRPGFALAVIVTLALGIAASTSTFAVVHGVLLRPLPFANGKRLVTLTNTIPAAAVRGFPFSLLEFIEHRDHNDAFEGLAAYVPLNVALTRRDAPELVPAARVSANFFDVLGVHATLGRAFVRGDDLPGAACGVVLRDGYWRTRFAASPDVVGQSIVIDDRTCQVFGVAPAEFRLPPTADVWLPDTIPTVASVTTLGRQSYRLIGRLAEGVNIDQAANMTNEKAGQFYLRHPGFYSGEPWKIVLTPLANQMIGDVSATLFMLSAAVGLMFAIACANVAQLMLARLQARDREFAIRAALGARRRQLFCQIATECAVLCLIAGALGFWLASIAVRAFLAAQPLDLPRQESIRVDAAAAAFALIASLAVAMLVAAAPVLKATRQRAGDTLRQGRSGPSPAVRWLREGLVTIQVALTMMLIVAASLFAGSLDRLSRVAPGFATDNRLVAQVSAPASRYSDGIRASALFREIITGVAALPGVVAAGGVSALPLSGQDPRAAFSVQGWTPEQAGRASDVHYRMISGEYFRAVGMQLVGGRWLTPTDARDAPPVAVVNESFARRFWSATSTALGQRVSFDRGDTWHTIVGVAADVKHQALDAEDEIEVFVPYEQAGTAGTAMTLVVQAAATAGSLAPAIRRRVAEIDSQLPLRSVRTMDDVVAASVARPRLRTTLTSLFAILGLLLAAIGTFSVLAQFVSEHAREIALRRALGAPAGAIVLLTMSRGVRVLTLGLVLGIAGALALSGSIRAQLFGISATQPMAYLLSAATLTIVGLSACLLPIRRAVRVDPLEELRSE